MVIVSTKLPIPSRTRPISVPTPMVLRLKTWESRSPPDLKRDTSLITINQTPDRTTALGKVRAKLKGTTVAGSSSPVRPKDRQCLRGRIQRQQDRAAAVTLQKSVAGWSSPVARQAHNLKVTGSNPVPATIVTCRRPAPHVRALAFVAKPPSHNNNIVTDLRP